MGRVKHKVQPAAHQYFCTVFKQSHRVQLLCPNLRNENTLKLLLL